MKCPRKRVNSKRYRKAALEEVTKTVENVVFLYDNQGRLIAESTINGSVQVEYVYLGDIPVAVFK